MSEARAYGLEYIKMGDPENDGSMGTNLTDLGSILQDTCDFTEDDPQVDDVFSEQEDDPVETFVTKGITQVKFSLMDVSPDALKEVKGGTVTGDKWESPDDTPVIEKSIEIMTRKKVKISIPRAKIIGKFNFQFRKRDVIVVDVSCRVLKPTDGSSPSVTAELVS